MPFSATTVTVELHTESGLDNCWTSTFTAPFVKDEATSFLAKHA